MSGSCSTAATACSASCAASLDYVGDRRGRDLAPARRPLPRPRAVLLRAEVRAAPAARRGRRLAGHGRPGTARSCTCPRAGATASAVSVGAWGSRRPGRDSRSSCASTCPDHVLEVGPLRVRFQEVPHFTRRQTPSSSPLTPARLTYGADHAPTDDLVEVRPRHRPAADRGHAAAAGARRSARAHDARRGRRARAPRAGPLGWCSRTSPTNSIRSGRAPRPSARLVARSSSPARAPATRSERSRPDATGR